MTIPCHTPFPIWNQSVPCLVLTVASWPAYRFLRRQVRWSGIPISLRIFQFVVIYKVKGFSIVSETEIDVFLKFSCFFYDPMDVGNFISKKLPNLDVRDLRTCICIHLCTCWRIRIGRSHFLPVFCCRLLDGDAYSRVHNSHTKSTEFYSAKLALCGPCLGQGVVPEE